MTDDASSTTAALRAEVHAIADTPRALRTWRFTRSFIQFVLWRWFRVEIVNAEGLTAEGAVIYAPVHRSNLDSPLIAAGAERRFRVLAKQSLFKLGPAKWFISCLGAFPVERGTADREALRTSLDLLGGGEPLLVFPEGTRQSGPQVGEVFDGVAYLAAKSGAKVIPIAIAGTEEAMPTGAKLPRREKVVIIVGEHMTAPVSESGRITVSGRAAFSSELRDVLQELLDQANAQRA